MCCNYNTNLWLNNHEHFFRGITIEPQQQEGGTCVSTSLAMLTGQTPQKVRDFGINTQNPVTWSLFLENFEMKLAYCPVDVRKLRFYMDELINYNDLFLLCYYSINNTDEQILGAPNDNGWVCGSHLVILHKDQIIDPATGTANNALQDNCMDAQTKRVFRVVPKDYKRGL